MYKTSYFAKVRKMSAESQRCCAGIVRYMPPSIKNMPNYDFLAPHAEILREYKRYGNENCFEEQYRKQLDTLDINEVKRLIPRGTIFLCYEKSGDFCHRHILADWLKNNGVDCEEIV